MSAQPNDQIEINNEKNSLEDLEFTDRTAQSTNFKHPSDFPSEFPINIQNHQLLIFELF